MIFNIELTEDNEYLVTTPSLSAFGVDTNPNKALKDCIAQLLDLRDDLKEGPLGKDLTRQLKALKNEKSLLDKFQDGYVW